MIIAATGHRPDKLGGYGEVVAQMLRQFATEYMRERNPEKVISGMALGWDTAWAQAAVDLKIPFIAVVPCPEQEKRWPPQSQRIYRELLAKADNVVMVNQYYSARSMQRRNEWMVKNCDEVAALWDGSLGGTSNCVWYAKKVGRPVINLWSRFMVT